MAADGGGFDGTSGVRAEVFAVLDRRLDPLRPAPLVVGLSGGSDSLALLALALDWARAVDRGVLALTVDHGLNPDSGRWTVEARAAARALGVDWGALAWEGPKPLSGLPAAARRARHALLAEAARAVGAAVVLLGHTADDVAESELIRRETPSHGRLHAWAPSPVWPQGRGVFVLRPLLGIRREALRELLAARGVGWLEDPANADTRFARPRARSALTAGPAASLPLEGRVGVGGGHTAVRAFPPSAPPPLPRDADAVSAAGVISLATATLAAAASRLTRAISCAAGREASPSRAAVARLAARLRPGEAWTATLGGARVAFEGDTVTLCRDLGRRLSDALPLVPAEPLVFDGRFEVVADAPGWRVGALAGHAAALPREDRRRLADIPAAARPALPVLLHDTDGARLPRPFGGGPADAGELVSARFRAAIGQVDGERTLAPDLPGCAVHGAETYSPLSWAIGRGGAKPSWV